MLPNGSGIIKSKNPESGKGCKRVEKFPINVEYCKTKDETEEVDMTIQTIRKIFTREFALGFFSQFAFISVFYILIPTLPIYLLRSGSEEVEIGVLIGIFFVSALALRPFVGKALLRIPEKYLYDSRRNPFCPDLPRLSCRPSFLAFVSL